MNQQKILIDIVDEFENETLPLLEKHLTKSYIHGDVNEQNLLIDENEHVCGILDFDDFVWSFPIVDLATAMMYLSLSLEKHEILDKLHLLYKGYLDIRTINDVEKSSLYNLCLMRFVQSTAVSFYQHEVIDPQNDYLILHTKYNWEKINFFLTVGKESFMEKVCNS